MNPETITMLVEWWRSTSERHGTRFTHLLLGADVVKGTGEDVSRSLSTTLTEQIGQPISVEVVTDRARFPATNALWGNESWAEKMERHEALSS